MASLAADFFAWLLFVPKPLNVSFFPLMYAVNTTCTCSILKVEGASETLGTNKKAINQMKGEAKILIKELCIPKIQIFFTK